MKSRYPPENYIFDSITLKQILGVISELRSLREVKMNGCLSDISWYIETYDRCSVSQKRIINKMAKEHGLKEVV